MTTTRFEMRIEKSVKDKAERARVILGHRSMSEYVATLVNENASRVIAKHEAIRVKEDVFDQFLEACTRASEPNAALRDAAEFVKDQGIG